jgi:hypothetical protein
VADILVAELEAERTNLSIHSADNRSHSQKYRFSSEFNGFQPVEGVKLN